MNANRNQRARIIPAPFLRSELDFGDRIMTDELELTVSVNAENWANARRRIAFIEAALARLLRENTQLREWFTAKELAAMTLPGLACTAASITRKAAHHNWRHKTVMQEGRKVLAYHYTSLPNTAFEALIRRLIDIPDIESFIPELPESAPKQQAEPTPQWMLPLMRLIKTHQVESWQEAYTMLEHRFGDENCPTPFQVEQAFQRLIK